MISWGMKVNDYGNAQQDENKDFIKIPGKGLTEELWAEMKAYADSKDITGGNYKKLNLPFENKILSQSAEVRSRMAKDVEEFTYSLLVDVFNAEGTADIAIDEILNIKSFHAGAKSTVMESAEEWTEAAIISKAAHLDTDKGPDGDFDD
jgi:fructose-bisphosphate aldolase, class II